MNECTMAVPAYVCNIIYHMICMHVLPGPMHLVPACLCITLHSFMSKVSVICIPLLFNHVLHNACDKADLMYGIMAVH